MPADSPISTRVTAVVVTYNRLNLLQRCLTALLSQSFSVDSIVVVNNGSTDGTAAWLRAQPGVQVIHQGNDGGAAGFATGITVALTTDCDWVWCMDDDGYPDTDALHELIRFQKLAPCVLNSLVYSAEESGALLQSFSLRETNEGHFKGVISGRAAFFNGTLIHRSVIKMAGIPNKKLVIWGDEEEYFFRILKYYNQAVYTVWNSRFFHPAASAKFYLRDWNEGDNWRVYFYIRNRIFVYDRRLGFRLFSTVMYVIFCLNFLLLFLLIQRSSFTRKIYTVLISMKDGLLRKTTMSLARAQTLFADR